MKILFFALSVMAVIASREAEKEHSEKLAADASCEAQEIRKLNIELAEAALMHEQNARLEAAGAPIFRLQDGKFVVFNKGFTPLDNKRQEALCWALMFDPLTRRSILNGMERNLEHQRANERAMEETFQKQKANVWK